MKKKINPRQVVEKRKNLADKLTEDLEEKGVILFKPVDLGGTLNIDIDKLILPKDLTEIPSRDLGNYLNAFTQQKSYMRTLTSWQEIYVEESKRKYYDKYYILYSELTQDNPKLSEKAKEIMCNNDPEVKEEFLDYKDNKAKFNMLVMNLESLTECIFLISREISRRGIDLPEEVRYSNLK